jgi:hypothetical protein
MGSFFALLVGSFALTIDSLRTTSELKLRRPYAMGQGFDADTVNVGE